MHSQASCYELNATRIDEFQRHAAEQLRWAFALSGTPRRTQRWTWQTASKPRTSAATGG
jgi:hypothetical protein